MPTQSTGRWKDNGGAGRQVGFYAREGDCEENASDKELEKEDEEGGGRNHILVVRHWRETMRKGEKSRD